MVEKLKKGDRVIVIDCELACATDARVKLGWRGTVISLWGKGSYPNVIFDEYKKHKWSIPIAGLELVKED